MVIQRNTLQIPPLQVFVMSPVTESQVQSKLAALHATKAYIYIPTKLIKLASDLLSAPLTQISNESIETGVVPEIFKISRVTPIYKNGAATDMANYRPISVITLSSKVLERIVYNQLISYIEKHNILYNFQFGKDCNRSWPNNLWHFFGFFKSIRHCKSQNTFG